jgi:hypothetical protein
VFDQKSIVEAEVFHDWGIGTSSECLKTMACDPVTPDAASTSQLFFLCGIGDW